MTVSRFSRLLLWCALLCGTAPRLAAEPQRRDRESRPRRQAEITLRLIEASSVFSKTGEDAESLVPAELKNLLRFKHYRLMDSGYVRGRENETLTIALAVTLQGSAKFTVEDRNGAATLHFEVEVEGPPNQKGERESLLETETVLKNGETVVLGASRMRDLSKALIVLLTARLVP